jgi:hypothetical protein
MRRAFFVACLLPLVAIIIGLHMPGGHMPGWLRSLHGNMAGLHGSPADAAHAPHAAPVVIHFDLVNRHILFPARVNGAGPLTFMLDTRDKSAVVDLDRAKALGLSLGKAIGVTGVGPGHATGALVNAATVSLAGLPGFSQPVLAALPLAPLAGSLGRAFDGLLGTDFITRFVVEVDYLGHELRLHDPATWTYSGPGESIPVRLDANGHPVLDASITTSSGESITGRFALDLGAGSGLTLSTPFVAAHHLPGAGVSTVRLLGVSGTGGAVAGRVGRLGRLTIGSLSLDDLLTVFAEDQAGSHASTEIDGNIGEAVAARFRLFLDYARQRVIFEPNATYAERPDDAQAGAAVRAEGANFETLRVVDVLERSPAADAGLRVGDVIQAMDGRSDGLTLTSLLDRFAREAPCPLTIRRGAAILQITVTPRRIV